MLSNDRQVVRFSSSQLGTRDVSIMEWVSGKGIERVGVRNGMRQEGTRRGGWASDGGTVGTAGREWGLTR